MSAEWVKYCITIEKRFLFGKLFFTQIFFYSDTSTRFLINYIRYIFLMLSTVPSAKEGLSNDAQKMDTNLYITKLPENILFFIK